MKGSECNISNPSKNSMFDYYKFKPGSGNLKKRNGYLQEGVLYPIQPDLSLNTCGYQEKIVLWNPKTNNSAVLFQFYTKESQRKKYSILPDGCIEVLFRCSLNNPQLTIFGKRTQNHTLTLEPNYIYFGFRPFYEAGFAAGSINYLDIMNQEIDVTQEPEFEKIIIAISNADSFKDRCKVFCDQGMQLFWNPSFSYNHVVECSRKICLSCGRIQISDLSKDIGYTDRYIRNTYKNTFGIAPALYRKIIRFQSSVHLMRHTDSYIEISYQSGYCDQSHMISDYNRLVHMTPRNMWERILHNK